MDLADLPDRVRKHIEQNQPELFSITDIKGRIVYVSEEFAQLTGYLTSELRGENHRLLKSGDQPQEMFDTLWYDISHGKVWHGTIKNRAKDGSHFIVDTTITPIPGKSLRETYYVSTRKLVKS